MCPVSNVSRGKLKLFVKDSKKLHGELQTAFDGATFHPIFTNPENNENVKLSWQCNNQLISAGKISMNYHGLEVYVHDTKRFKNFKGNIWCTSTDPNVEHPWRIALIGTEVHLFVSLEKLQEIHGFDDNNNGSYYPIAIGKARFIETNE